MPCQRRTLVRFPSAFCLGQEGRTPVSKPDPPHSRSARRPHTSAVSCAAPMPEKANKVSRSRESESKKECFYRESWRHRSYLPEPAIFRHSKLRL
jgi:hypothetical protein